MRNVASAVSGALFFVALAGNGSPPAERAADDESESPDPRFAVADTLREERQYQEALNIYRALRDEFAAAGDTAQQWRSELWHADMLRRTGDADSSEAALARAQSLAGDDPQRVAATRLGVCNLLSYRGESDAAIAECTDALALAESINDRHLEARAHFLLGTIHSRRGRYQLSVAETEKALELRRRYGGTPYEMAGVLNSMGIEYAAVGRLGEAENMYREGLALADTFATPSYSLYLHSNLAHLRAATGDMEGALDSIGESLRGAEEVKDKQAMLYAHNSFAEFYVRAGNLAAARRHLEESLALNEDVSHIHRVISLAMLGDIEAAEGDGEQAESTLSEALALAEASDFGLQGVNIRATLTRLAAARGDAAAARRLADEAVAIAGKLGSPDAMITALEARAEATEAGGGDAPGAYLKAIDLLESWRGRLVLGDLRMGVAEPHWEIYEGAIRSLFVQDRADAAFEVAERARARLLLELLAERDASQPAPSQAERIRRQLRARFQERLAATEDAAIEALDGEIRQLTTSLASLESKARQSDPVTGAARFPQPASLASVQANLLEPGQALLAYFWGDEQAYAWWITADEVRAARLGDVDALAARIDFLRAAIEQPTGGPAWAVPARAAFEALIAPLAPTPAKEILVVADGPVAHIPIEVLIPEKGGEPLGATTRIAYGPSASVLLSLELARRPETWERSILIVGNPAIEGGESGLASLWRDDPLAPLPHAAEEARSIYRQFGDQDADLLLGAKATLDAWNGFEPGRYRYLHFAAHARVSDRRPEQTHLVLVGGRLDLAAIRKLDLRTELVTLSACETGRGRRVRGEGIIGLSHAFLAAGARGTVVTLWRIDDEAAAGFMQSFYERLHHGDSPAGALMSVRRERIAAGDSDPAYWAPFVLVGGI